MKAGIIAAGMGERMTKGGIPVSKPLVPILGDALIARVIKAAHSAGAESVACIINEVNVEVKTYLERGPWPLPVDLVVRTTPSSMESLFGLQPLLGGEPFLLFTVDAVFRPEVPSLFLSKALTFSDAGAVLALTDYVDDEKPLWAKMDDSSGRIMRLGPEARPTPFVTAGLYHFGPDIFTLIPEARRRNLGALREFLALLTESGFPLYGVPIPKTIDVDHPADIQKAEDYLRETGGH